MKVCLICFDFKESNIRLQPWRYIYEISKRLASKNINVDIISDGYPALPQEDKIDSITIHRLRRLTSFPFSKNNDLIRLIKKKPPDLILWVIGPTAFYFLASMKRINAPIIGLWTGTTYSLKNIMSLGGREIVRNFRSIYNPAINTLTPSFLIKYTLSNTIFKKIIVLNENNRMKMNDYDVAQSKISVVPPGITDYELKPPKNSEIKKLRNRLKLKENDFIVLYLGSPSSLRGVDTLINGVSIVNKDIPSLKLILLSRRRSHEFLKEESYVKNLCINKKIDNNTKVISAFLSRDEIKNFIDLSDVVVLPFKLVQSDTPIAILEVMALGKPLISTKLDGIPELLKEGRGVLIDPNDPQDLADALFTLYSNLRLRNDIGERAKKYMLKYPTWDQTTQNIISMINEIIDQNPNL